MMPSLPNFHDGLLTGMMFSDGWAKLSLRRENGEAAELNLSGLEALHAEDVRQGNIINSVEVVQGQKPDEWVLLRLFPAPHPAAAQQYHDAYTRLLAGKAAKIEAGEAAIVVITPSYGADLVALCTSVAIEFLSSDGSGQPQRLASSGI